VNLNQCPVQDERLNPLLAEVKQDLKERGWSIYNEDRTRAGCATWACGWGGARGSMLLTLVSTAPNFKGH
jgi:23S rRNA (uracil1939-C5)-methyltransferase